MAVAEAPMSANRAKPREAPTAEGRTREVAAAAPTALAVARNTAVAEVRTMAAAARRRGVKPTGSATRSPCRVSNRLDSRETIRDCSVQWQETMHFVARWMQGELKGNAKTESSRSTTR